METIAKQTRERAYDRFNDVLVRDYGKTLAEVCEALGFKQEYIDFIKVDESDIAACKANARKYKPLIMALENDPLSKKRRGDRTWTEYIKTIICGWIGENLFAMYLTKNGFTVKCNGADKDRKIETGNNVGARPDFIVGYGGSERKIELIQETNSIAENDGYIDLRGNKIQRCAENKAIVVYRELLHKKYVMIDFACENARVRRIDYHKGWTKPAMRYFLEDHGKRLQSMDNFFDELRFRITRQEPVADSGKVIVVEEEKKLSAEEEVKAVEESKGKTISKQQQQKKDEPPRPAVKEEVVELPSDREEGEVEIEVSEDLSDWV